VRVTAPGFEGKEIEVTALPDAIFIKAESDWEQEKIEGELRVSKMASKKLFRKVDLPLPIEVETATAKLENGVLELVAVKAREGKE
jgi:HSP20 family molecular chaperone IbpA